MQKFLCIWAACGLRIHPSMSVTGSACRARKHASSVCGPCVGTSSVHLSKNRTELMRTFPGKHGLRIYNARCAHWPTPNSGRNKLSFPALAQRASKTTELASHLQVTTHGVRTDQHSTATEINSRSSHLHARTMGEQVRAPYVSSACKYCLHTLTWQSQGNLNLLARCQHVPLTHHLRNVRYVQPLTPKRLCGPRIHTLHNRECDMLLLLPRPT